LGDFLLDFRPRGRRCEQSEALRFFPDMAIDRVVRDEFSLFVTRSGRDSLWAPFESSDRIVVAVAGRVALEPSTWEAGARVEGAGGAACKAIYREYRQRGLAALCELSGGFALHLYDPVKRVYYLVNDSGGAFPCYSAGSSAEVICSHPDVMAQLDTSGASSRSTDSWDLTSMAQFIATGVVSFPRSYYRHVAALDFGCVHTFQLAPVGPPVRSATRYESWESEQLSTESEDQIAQRLADAIVASARRRTLPVLGRTAVALSGGLDSRTILCAAEKHDQLFAFCAFDEENAEFRNAQAIADCLGVRLAAFPRAFDHYADHAEMGVRISGGMGELASNHFLGFRDRLNELGAENLVTGCYFDYLFKSLALDAFETGLLRRERLRAFSFQTYLPHFPVAPRFSAELRGRLEALFPAPDRNASDPRARARNALRRIFPLYHEGDNAQRLIPQRVMGWYPPAIDPVVLKLSRATPPELKLNKRLFRATVRRACGEALCRIPDSNTELPLAASALRVGIQRYRIALRRRMERRLARMATEESWPNWPHYIRTSRKLHALWQRPNPVARELISELCGAPFREDVASYGERPTQYFMRLLTLKLWADQRSAT
jgi:asparagine synthase (glutamine-hydrolysing)